jgi:hypothetical protein
MRDFNPNLWLVCIGVVYVAASIVLFLAVGPLAFDPVACVFLPAMLTVLRVVVLKVLGVRFHWGTVCIFAAGLGGVAWLELLLLSAVLAAV